MNAWWNTLSARERRLLLGGAGAIVLAALYWFVVEPLHAKHARLTAQMASSAQTATRIERLAMAATSLRHTGRTQGKIPAGQSLLAVLNQTAQATALQSQIKRIVPNGEHEANVALDEASFDAVHEWLIKLDREFGISIARIVIDKTDKPDRVNANLTLNAAG